jgi:hypothetical protein
LSSSHSDLLSRRQCDPNFHRFRRQLLFFLLCHFFRRDILRFASHYFALLESIFLGRKHRYRISSRGFANGRQR